MQRKLKLLDGAARLDDLAIPAGNRRERLKGQRGERHSIRVNDQERVVSAASRQIRRCGCRDS